MNGSNYPRIIISGLAGDSGKTMVSCGLTALLKRKGLNVTCFKKGPDYIDSAWLSLASGLPARNLDSYMMGFPVVKESFLKQGNENGINIIEGNRGLFDGLDAKGTHSTYELAKTLQAPIVIVMDISKVTRTAAAYILGCLYMDPKIKIQGVILNRAAGIRHINIVKEAVEGETGVPVLGAIPKLSDRFTFPSRHLGLIMPDELDKKTNILNELQNIIEENVDVLKVLDIINNAPVICRSTRDENTGCFSTPLQKEKITIGYFRDISFSFYYPENLEKLEEAGAELIPLSSTNQDDSVLLNNPETLDAVYIGGGFPEINLSGLTANSNISHALKNEIEKGLPVYAECGGLMYLANSVTWKNKEYKLAGVLPIEIQMHSKPQGHGYTEAIVDENNPFFEKGVLIKGHEFHYSEIKNYTPEIKTSLAVIRGTGSIANRDGLIYKNVFASYIHIHASASPEWVNGMIKIAKSYKQKKHKLCLVGG